MSKKFELRKTYNFLQCTLHNLPHASSDSPQFSHCLQFSPSTQIAFLAWLNSIMGGARKHKMLNQAYKVDVDTVLFFFLSSNNWRMRKEIRHEAFSWCITLSFVYFCGLFCRTRFLNFQTYFYNTQIWFWWLSGGKCRPYNLLQIEIISRHD